MLPRRRHTLTRGWLLAALALVGLINSRVAAQSTAVEGVLVLRNGNVLSGAVRRFGDDYRIDAGGTTLQLPAAQVEMFAPSLAEAYEARRRDRVGASADSHIELARWCLQLGLLEQAARELLDARTLEPGHRGAVVVERQLQQLLELQTLRNAPPPRVHEEAIVDTGDESIQEALPIDIPSEAHVQFVRSIQPMLLHSCATGGCHQPGSSESFQLNRWALEGIGSADLMRRNLTAVLRQIDATEPSASPLVHRARTTHGRGVGHGSRPLTARQTTLLLDWLNHAAGIAEYQPPVQVANWSSDNPPVDEGVEQAAFLQPMAEAGEEEQPIDPHARRASKFKPRDAFDPEIFNRRFAELAAAVEPAEPDASSTESAEAPSRAPDP